MARKTNVIKEHLKFPLLVVSKHDGAASVSPTIVNNQDDLVDFFRDTWDTAPEDSLDEVILYPIDQSSMKLDGEIYGSDIEVKASYSFLY